MPEATPTWGRRRRALAAVVWVVRPVLLPVVLILNSGVRAVAAFTHRVQYVLQWAPRDNPEWFDHDIDLYWAWRSTGKVHFVERGGW